MHCARNTFSKQMLVRSSTLKPSMCPTTLRYPCVKSKLPSLSSHNDSDSFLDVDPSTILDELSREDHSMVVISGKWICTLDDKQQNDLFTGLHSLGYLQMKDNQNQDEDIMLSKISALQNIDDYVDKL